jgi:predicted alpha/beta-fold hydrolase
VSLGGNALCKLLGEEGERGGALVRAAAAVSAPLDLAAAAASLERGFARVYGWSFLRTLRPRALARLRRFPDLFDAAALVRATTLRAFDEAVTAPIHGFRDAADYYARSSGKAFLRDVRVPLLLLNARDDPFLPASALPRPDELAPSVRAIFPAHGGHVGFVGAMGGLGWLPAWLLDALTAG